MMPKLLVWHKGFFLIITIAILLTSSIVADVQSSSMKDEDIEIFQVNHIGSTILLVLDYNFKTDHRLENENESLFVLVLVSNSVQTQQSKFEAAMLFVYTVTNESFLFWMLGDPYRQIQFWQAGTENEHYQVADDQLNLCFLECSLIDDPDIEIIVLAKTISEFEVSHTTNDFTYVLEKFIHNLNQYVSFPITMATSTELSTTIISSELPTGKAPAVIYGFEFIIAIISILLLHLFKKNRCIREK